MQLDALLRSDGASTVRAALVALRGVARLCSLLRGGKAVQPSSLRDAPGAKVLMSAFGALEALVSRTPELRDEAVAAGSVTTAVKLLHYLLASEKVRYHPHVLRHVKLLHRGTCPSSHSSRPQSRSAQRRRPLSAKRISCRCVWSLSCFPTYSSSSSRSWTDSRRSRYSCGSIHTQDAQVDAKPS